TAFLPYDEAVAALDKASRSAEAEERAYAYELLVRCAARTGDPDAVTGLLNGLTRIRNEQDPVRSRLLTALAEVRPDLFAVAAVGRATRIRNDAVVRSAVALWLWPPHGRAEKAAVLVGADESMVTLPDVLAAVTRRRTDLVDRYVLAGRRLRGRFGTGKAWWVPAVHPAALALWTPAQVARYAGLLRKGVHDKGLDRWQRAALARTVAGLPGHAP